MPPRKTSEQELSDRLNSFANEFFETKAFEESSLQCSEKANTAASLYIQQLSENNVYSDEMFAEDRYKG